MKTEQIIYLIGIAVFGLGYYAIKSHLNNDMLLIALAAAYLLSLRFIAVKLANIKKKKVK